MLVHTSNGKCETKRGTSKDLCTVTYNILQTLVSKL